MYCNPTRCVKDNQPSTAIAVNYPPFCGRKCSLHCHFPTTASID